MCVTLKGGLISWVLVTLWVKKNVGTTTYPRALQKLNEINVIKVIILSSSPLPFQIYLHFPSKHTIYHLSKPNPVTHSYILLECLLLLSCHFQTSYLSFKDKFTCHLFHEDSLLHLKCPNLLVCIYWGTLHLQHKCIFSSTTLRSGVSLYPHI